MKMNSCYCIAASSCALLVIFISMTACKNLNQEIGSEDGKIITGKTQPRISAPACSRDLPDLKTQDGPNSNCVSCHTKCVNLMHCKKLGDTWVTNNCLSCHKAYP